MIHDFDSAHRVGRGFVVVRAASAGPDWPDLASYIAVEFGTYIPKAWLPEAAAAAPDGQRDERAPREFLAGPVADLVPATGIAHNVMGTLLSPRLGCQIFPPFSFGVDLAALCPSGDTSASDSPTA